MPESMQRIKNTISRLGDKSSSLLFCVCLLVIGWDNTKSLVESIFILTHNSFIHEIHPFLYEEDLAVHFDNYGHQVYRHISGAFNSLCAGIYNRLCGSSEIAEDGSYLGWCHGHTCCTL